MSDDDFMAAVKDSLRGIFKGEVNDYALKWEQFKQEIKMKAMEKASAIKYRERKKGIASAQ